MRNSERLPALVSDLMLCASSALKVYSKRTDLAGLVKTSIGSARDQADQSNISLVANVPLPLLRGSAEDRAGARQLDFECHQILPRWWRSEHKCPRNRRLDPAPCEGRRNGNESRRLAKVFKRFFRTDSARQASISGAGLGLSITGTIVERHGGDISCESRPGDGSTFTLTLPADGPPRSF